MTNSNRSEATFGYEQTVKYEIARDLLNGLRAELSERLAHERDKPLPDHDILFDLQNRMLELALRIDWLDVTDEAALDLVVSDPLVRIPGAHATENDPATSELNDAEIAWIFDNVILPDFVHAEQDRPLPTDPTLFILGGQPGSGKTGVLDSTAKALALSGATWAINADDFAAYHPRYRMLQARHGVEAADMVRSVSSKWMRSTIDAALRRRVNVVLESTMRQPEVVMATLSFFREGGYATHAKILAVHPLESWQGNHYRRERLSAAGALSRIATRKSHDDAFSGSSKTIHWIEATGGADSILVVDRSDRVIEQSILGATGWSVKSMSDRLSEIRNAPLTPQRATELDARWVAVEFFARDRFLRDGRSPEEAEADLEAIAEFRR